MLLNNLCESFNRYILEAKDKLILTMVGTIRTKLMQKIALKHIAIEKYSGPLCPKIQKKSRIKLSYSQVDVGLNILVVQSIKSQVVYQINMLLTFSCDLFMQEMRSH